MHVLKVRPKRPRGK